MHKFLPVGLRLAGFLLVLMWVFQAPAEARVYKWRDAEGKLHFTDNPEQIPQKYRSNLELFKEDPSIRPVPKPKTEEPSENGESQDENASPEAEAQPSPNMMGQPPPLTPEEKKLITSLHKELMKLWKDHVRIFLFYEDKEEDFKKIAAVAQKSADSKKNLAKMIGKNESPYLKGLQDFLKATRKKEKRLRPDSSYLKKRVANYKRNLRTIIPQEKVYVEDMGRKLRLKDPPLPTLEQEIEKIVKRKKIIQESEKRRKSSKMQEGRFK